MVNARLTKNHARHHHPGMPRNLVIVEISKDTGVRSFKSVVLSQLSLEFNNLSRNHHAEITPWKDLTLNPRRDPKPPMQVPLPCDTVLMYRLS